MTHRAAQVIRGEHAAIAAMLRTVLLLLAQHRREHTLPRFDALRAMLFYADEFPAREHHRKETELLFTRLRARTPLWRDQLDQLDSEHARGDFYLQHMAMEECDILPLAERVLTAEDWADLDAAFAEPAPPGELPDAAYQALFTQIVNQVPAPLGLGAAAH
ncbi:MAG: hemerythrin [Variovorax paradoxus]|uniref:Hemerythrin n=1 Tax=Variovorax paradoxus TaxID=34073 RepID=A0A2W5SB68_VARPD|nr:MAG: hemerythrin [Variovorax paradoxus]